MQGKTAKDEEASNSHTYMFWEQVPQQQHPLHSFSEMHIQTHLMIVFSSTSLWNGSNSTSQKQNRGIQKRQCDIIIHNTRFSRTLMSSLSLLALIYGVEEASSGLNNAHMFTLQLFISSSFLSVFLHQELSKADSRRLSGLRHHSVSFLQPVGCWLFLLGGFRKKAGHHDLRCSSGLLQLFQASLPPWWFSVVSFPSCW